MNFFIKDKNLFYVVELTLLNPLTNKKENILNKYLSKEELFYYCYNNMLILNSSQFEVLINQIESDISNSVNPHLYSFKINFQNFFDIVHSI